MKKNKLAESAYRMLIEESRKLAILYYESGRYVDAAASWSEVVNYTLKLDLLQDETEKPEPEQWEKGDVLLAKNGDLVLFESYDKNGLNFTAQLIYAKNPPVLGDKCWLVPSFKKAVSNIETPSADHVGRKAVVLEGECKGKVGTIECMDVYSSEEAYNITSYYIDTCDEFIRVNNLYILPEKYLKQAHR